MPTPSSLPRRFAANLKRSRIVLYSTLLPAMLILAAFSLEGPKKILYVVLGFSLIIFVHELGHFIVARLCSVKTEVFSIGIGPRLIGWKKGVGLSFGNEPDVIDATSHETKEALNSGDLQQTAEGTPEGVTLHERTNNLESTLKNVGECDYRISWLPLGGYVPMLGQDDLDPSKVSSDPRSFNNRPIWQRMCIVSAGVTMNIIFALVVFAIIFSPKLGAMFPPATVGGVVADSPAENAQLKPVGAANASAPASDAATAPATLVGLQPGDEVTAIDGEHPREGFLEFTDIMIASALSNRGETVDFTIRRDGKLYTTAIKPEFNKTSGFLAIGVEGPLDLKVNVVPEADLAPKAKTLEPGLVELARRGKNATIIAADGQPVHSYAELFRHVQEAFGKDVKLTFKPADGGAPFDATFHTRLSPRVSMSDSTTLPSLAGIYPRPMVQDVEPNSPAEKAGMKAGDIIVRVGATAYPSLVQFTDAIRGSAENPIAVHVLREGQSSPVTLTVTPTTYRGKGKAGVELVNDYDHPVISTREAVTDGPFARVSDGATILSVNDTPVANWNDYRRLLLASPGKTVAIKFADGSQQTTAQLKITPEEIHQLNRYQYLANVPLSPLLKLQKADSYLGGMQMGVSHTYKFIVQTYLTLRGLFTQTVPIDKLHGPLGIGKIGYDAQEHGPAYLWFILAVVSVNLAVANFLPLPIVDGGLFILLIIEKLRGRPLPLKVLNVINIAGLCLLASIFLFVTFNNDLGLFWRH